MSPDEKLHLQISRALDANLKKYSSWEIQFLKNVSKLLENSYKSASPKQKKMAWQLTKVQAIKD